MSRGPRRATSTSTYRKIAGGILAAAVAAGTAYAVPSTAEAAPSGAPAAAADHLSTRLSALVAADQAGLGPAATAEELSLPQTGAGSLLRAPDGQRVVVDIRLSSPDSSTMQAIKTAGAKVLNDDQYSRVAVSVLPEDLMAIGGVAGVEYVGEELTPQVNAVCDTTKSEGDAILNADDLRATGVDGTGVKVGVLSDSYAKAAAPFTTAAQDIVSDNLPGAANTCGHTSVSSVADKPSAGTDEGRGMMQIVHDLAPGSPLDFATAFTSEPSFAANITALANQGAKVIVDDVTYFDEPMYQDGIVEQAVTGVRASGVDYFSSSSNNRYVKNGHEVGSYEAVDGYRPTSCPPAITGHADCHNFGTAGSPDSTFSYTPANGQVIRAILNWAEPWNGGVNTDFDLYLVNQDTNAVLLSSATVNAGAGSQQAFEFFAATQNTSVGNWGLVVARKSAVAPAATPRFKVVFAGNGNQPFSVLEHETPVAGTTDVMGPTAFGHNGGADAVSVGASDVRVATNLNSYSSYGPVTTLFGPVNGSTPAAPLATPRVVAKPDLVASDCNVTTFFAGAGPPFHFCGTSAAAPHAAAVAALLMQKFPSATAATINTAMTSTATPIAGVPGSFQGGGLVDALAASNAVPAAPAMPTVSGTDPVSPAASTTPKVKGTADAGSTVDVYATSDCSGSPVGTGTAAVFASPGIQVTVAVGSTTTFHATATNGFGSSACSTTSTTYVQQDVPAMPTVSGTDPVSPAASTTPKVKGTADAGSTVDVYATSDCSGSPVGTGTAAVFASPGIQVTVAVGSTTTFHATATNGAGSSACSTTSTTYVQQNATPPPPAPDTVLTKTPKAKVTTTKRRAKVSFEFTSTIGGSTFACSIDGQAFASCTSGATYKLKPGQHTFAVRATASGVTDPTPASYTFKVKRKKKHH